MSARTSTEQLWASRLRRDLSDLTDEQREEIRWIYGCHRPLDESQRQAWVHFYAVHVRAVNEGRDF